MTFSVWRQTFWQDLISCLQEPGIMFAFCIQFLCKWMINFHKRRLLLGSSCVGRSGFHGPDLRWEMDGCCPALPLVRHTKFSSLIGWALTESTWAGDWQELVSNSWFYSLSRSPTVGPDTRVSCSPIGRLTPTLVSDWLSHGLPQQGPAARDHPPQEAGAHRRGVLHPGASQCQAPGTVWKWVSSTAKPHM